MRSAALNRPQPTHVTANPRISEDPFDTDTLELFDLPDCDLLDSNVFSIISSESIQSLAAPTHLSYTSVVGHDSGPALESSIKSYLYGTLPQFVLRHLTSFGA